MQFSPRVGPVPPGPQGDRFFNGAPKITDKENDDEEVNSSPYVIFYSVDHLQSEPKCQHAGPMNNKEMQNTKHYEIK